MNAKAPLIHVCGAEIRIDPRRNDLRDSGKRIRKVRPIRRLEWSRCLPQTQRRIAGQRSQAVPDDVMIVESPECGTHHCAGSSERTQSQTKARARTALVGYA